MYIAEFCALASALALNRRGDRPLPAFLSAPAGLIGVTALVGVVVSLAVIGSLVRRCPPPRIRRTAVSVAVNLGSLCAMLAGAEGAVRLFAVRTEVGPIVGGTVLLPYRWEEVAARNRKALDGARNAPSYLVADSELGWTIGPSRHSEDYNRPGADQFLARMGYPPRRSSPADGQDPIYLSSVEGLRSPRAGMSFMALPSGRRIAVVGDSFTFGLEVSYEQTWAHQLELVLGSPFQVLNFGVDGYGVDQAFLRYRRDVPAWMPERVILGIIDDDVRRTMCVYGFLCFPGFGMPFAKPRLALTEHGFAPVNLPLPQPEWMFTRRSITELPFLEIDRAFQPSEWTWHVYHHSYAIRLLLSRYPPWSATRAGLTADVTARLNGAILREFVRLARMRGSVPIVVFFPARSSFTHTAASPARQALRMARVRFLDMTDCVAAVEPRERFVALHYSAVTNAAVALCLRDAIDAGFESGGEDGRG